MDEAIGTRYSGSQGMDPPEQGTPERAVDASGIMNESLSQNQNNISHASSRFVEGPADTLEVSQGANQYPATDTHDMDTPTGTAGDAPSYGSPGADAVNIEDDDDQVPVYSYSESPQKGEEYFAQNQEQSRDDQYYEPLKEQSGSQDHEFFNAHSGGGEDEDDYPPSSFDQQQETGRHPDDFHEGY